jgi:type IV secretion system protein VirB10
MSATNIFANSPVATGSRFSSPGVKFAVAGGVAVGVFGAYMMLSGQATSLFRHETGPPQQPAPQVSPVSAAFRPMPPAVAAEVQTVRPRAAGPPTLASVIKPGTTDDQSAGISSKMDAYTAPTRSGASGGPHGPDDDAAGRHDRPAPGSLEESVIPTKFAPSGVTELPHPDYLIEQGRHLPCTQMSVINSTYAGSVSAIIPTAIRGETGDVELIGSGAKVFGTIQHGIANGIDRAFVLWQNISTPIVRDRDGVPHQFRVEVNSPASSALGETGLDGDINRHLTSKVGSVIGLSLLQGVTQGLANSLQSRGNNSNNGSPSINFNQIEGGTQNAGNLLAQQFINVPDILTRLQGKECAIELVRDLDLHAAYPKLKSLLAMQRNIQ